ncbi:protein of unknown function [Pseudomonas sp. JV551A1]|nr:protein of unknown function [Pseudomonas sp. JV551A1]
MLSHFMSLELTRITGYKHCQINTQSPLALKRHRLPDTKILKIREKDLSNTPNH